VAFGYVPLGTAFGMLFQDLGYSWYFAPLMGVFVYAGAAQFLAVGLGAAHAGVLEIAVSTLILNSRHLFFGLSVLGRYRARGLKKAYLIFGLTDETYSLVTSTKAPGPDRQVDYYLTVTALNQSYWVLGCTLGALAGSAMSLDTRGMDFALTALFLVLVLDQWNRLRELFPFVAAALCGVSALVLFREQMLLIAIGLSILLLLGRYRLEANGRE
jgi:4-azaleucine resistance transporter AzlC